MISRRWCVWCFFKHALIIGSAVFWLVLKANVKIAMHELLFKLDGSGSTAVLSAFRLTGESDSCIRSRTLTLERLRLPLQKSKSI